MYERQHIAVRLGPQSRAKGEDQMALTKEPPATISVEAASRILGISRRTAYKHVRSGAIPSIRLGTHIKIPTHRLVDLLDGKPAA